MICINSLILTVSQQVGAIVIGIWQRRKLRCREVKRSPQVHRMVELGLDPR